jgi:hypothetical protein
MSRVILPEGKLGRLIDSLIFAASDLGYRATPLGHDVPPESGPFLIELDDPGPREPWLRRPTRWIAVCRLRHGRTRLAVWWLQSRRGPGGRTSPIYTRPEKLRAALAHVRGDAS